MKTTTKISAAAVISFSVLGSGFTADVDIGAVTFTQSGVGPAPRAFPGSGVVWRISRSAEAK